MIQFVFDMETLELHHDLDDGRRLALVQMVTPGEEQKAIFSEEVERELRSNDEVWKRLCIDHKIRGSATTVEHQGFVKRILSFQPTIINPNHYRGQSIPFSMALAGCKGIEFVYPFTHLKSMDLKPITDCLRKFKIGAVDTFDILPG